MIDYNTLEVGSLNLGAFSPNIHKGTVVKSIIYDTSKDSDGGAWRKRCADRSWYTETLGGTNWLGQVATATAAWATPGAGVGSYFQNSTDGLFYQLGSASPAVTQVYRGNVREFPAQVAIIAESARVVIYDLTQPGVPMWMVFTASSGGTLYNGSLTSLSASNGQVVVGSVLHLAQADFVSDYTRFRNANGNLYNANRIVNRNAATGPITSGTIPAIVNPVVNDLAVTVLDTAPIDPATGLPVPTIAVATAGGVSVIKDDGTVVNSANTSAASYVSIAGTTLWLKGNGNNYLTFVPLLGISASFALTSVTTPFTAWPLGGSSNTALVGPKNPVMGSTAGMSTVRHNPAVSANSLLAYITNAYNSGWLPGDIRGAYLADTVAETITASGELVTNGTFTTDTSGWTTSASYASTSAAVAGEMQVTVSAGYGRQMSTVACVIGKTYRLQGSARVVSGTSRAFVGIGSNSAGTSATTAISTFSASALGFSLDFVATATSMYVSAGDDANISGGVLGFDNISVKLADADRSVKNTGLVLNGTLTKAAVASGAGLVAYSGFSASNYLEQPYSANLDFGTGDFCVMGWVNLATITPLQVLVDRADATSSTPRWRLSVAATTGLPDITLVTSGGNFSATGTSALPIGVSSFVAAVKSGTNLILYINGIQAAITNAAAATTLTNALGKLRIGCNAVDGGGGIGSSSMALWRISATAPSADQIAHIYRTELPLFQANAQCTIAGTSTAVTALAYDDVADTLQVGTSWGRTSFRDLLRIDSEATSTGAITSLSANEGVVLTGGASSGKVYAPAMYLRDELRRKDIARKALGRVPAFFDYTATASQTAFVAPKGFTIKALYKNGTLMREATTGTFWGRSSDGFQETATLSVGASVSDWISLMCVRV